MKRVNTINDLYKISMDWGPYLVYVDTIEEASDHINFPHEDYPQFLGSTKKAIQELSLWMKESGEITERDIKMVHQICMRGKPYLDLGVYRKNEVVVNNQLIPPHPYLINSFMDKILPISINVDPLKWYKLFETIHPFEDGNGRVGGIVLSVLSNLTTGRYLVSKIEPKYVTQPILDRITNSNDKLLNNPKYFDVSDSFKNRSLKYLNSKINNIKVERVLNDLNLMNKITQCIENQDINKIVKILSEIH